MLDHLDDNNSNKSSRTSAVTGISWLEDGMGFKIVNPKRFSQQALPEYFDTLKYKSFIRQVNIYGFKRRTEGSKADPAFSVESPTCAGK